MDIEKKDPSSLVEFLQGKYPKYGIDLYYDEKNLASHTQDLVEVIKNLDKLLDVLDEYIKDSQIFVRIHCFNQWIVVRIKADMEQECCFEKKIKDVFCGDLVNIISDEEYQIIKFCYSECAKGEEKLS